MPFPYHYNGISNGKGKNRKANKPIGGAVQKLSDFF
nr:MAG TPA: hypothetical protein [Caudoviricetes sp.]